MGTQDDWIRQTVRLPPETHEALKALAGKNNRSVNAQLLEIVQTWVEAETARRPEKASGDESAVIEAVRRLSPERQRALLTLLQKDRS
jgi:plasmid stability protein